MSMSRMHFNLLSLLINVVPMQLYNISNFNDTLYICDVICEKVPYCRTNIVGPDQTPHIMHNALRLIRAYDICL